MSRLHIDYSDPNGHINMNSFGLNQDDSIESKLDETFKTLGAVRPVIAEMMTRKAYYEDYGIYNASDLEDPLSLVKYNEKLDPIEGGPKRTWIRQYHIHNIREAFGLNIREFFEEPFSNARFMMEIAKKTKPLEGVDDLLKKK